MSDSEDWIRFIKKSGISLVVGIMGGALGFLVVWFLAPILRNITDFGAGIYAGFLWLELGVAIFGLLGFVISWRRLSKSERTSAVKKVT